jgi:hypothetical protein
MLKIYIHFLLEFAPAAGTGNVFSKQENKVHKFDQIWIFFCAKVPDRAQLQVE